MNSNSMGTYNGAYTDGAMGGPVGSMGPTSGTYGPYACDGVGNGTLQGTID